MALKSELVEIAGSFEYITVNGDPITTLINIGHGRASTRDAIVKKARPRKDVLLRGIKTLQEKLSTIERDETEAIRIADDKAAECARSQEGIFADTMEQFVQALSSARELANCTVCQRPNDGPTCMTDTAALKCGHVFHAECIDRMSAKYKFVDGSDTALVKFVRCPNCNQDHIISVNEMPSLQCNETLQSSDHSLPDVWRPPGRPMERGTPGFWGGSFTTE